MSGNPEFFERSQGLGVELENRPAERLAITGMVSFTPLGRPASEDGVAANN